MMSTAVEIFYGDNAEVRETLLKLLQFIAAEHIIFPALRTPRHDQMILAPSPNIRPTTTHHHVGSTLDSLSKPSPRRRQPEKGIGITEETRVPASSTD